VKSEVSPPPDPLSQTPKPLASTMDSDDDEAPEYESDFDSFDDQEMKGDYDKRRRMNKKQQAVRTSPKVVRRRPGRDSKQSGGTVSGLRGKKSTAGSTSVSPKPSALGSKKRHHSETDRIRSTECRLDDQGLNSSNDSLGIVEPPLPRVASEDKLPPIGPSSRSSSVRDLDGETSPKEKGKGKGRRTPGSRVPSIASIRSEDSMPGKPPLVSRKESSKRLTMHHQPKSGAATRKRDPLLCDDSVLKEIFELQRDVESEQLARRKIKRKLHDAQRQIAVLGEEKGRIEERYRLHQMSSDEKQSKLSRRLERFKKQNDVLRGELRRAAAAAPEGTGRDAGAGGGGSEESVEEWKKKHEEEYQLRVELQEQVKVYEKRLEDARKMYEMESRTRVQLENRVEEDQHEKIDLDQGKRDAERRYQEAMARVEGELKRKEQMERMYKTQIHSSQEKVRKLRTLRVELMSKIGTLESTLDDTKRRAESQGRMKRQAEDMRRKISALMEEKNELEKTHRGMASDLKTAKLELGTSQKQYEHQIRMLRASQTRLQQERARHEELDANASTSTSTSARRSPIATSPYDSKVRHSSRKDTMSKDYDKENYKLQRHIERLKRKLAHADAMRTPDHPPSYPPPRSSRGSTMSIAQLEDKNAKLTKQIQRQKRCHDIEVQMRDRMRRNFEHIILRVQRIMEDNGIPWSEDEVYGGFHLEEEPGGKTAVARGIRHTDSEPLVPTPEPGEEEKAGGEEE
jgi:hypothetical protein